MIFRPRTETCQRSRRRIFTCGEMKISTSPFICRGVAIFMPQKLGNLQFREGSGETAVLAAHERMIAVGACMHFASVGKGA